jgi:HNH endonuclease
MAPRRSESDRFFEKVDKKTDGCWEWQATRTPGPNGGYGVFYAFDPQHGKKRNMPAHRWSYNFHHGLIPEGLVVMHLCDNRACVNPAHLRIGTLRDNAEDMVSKGRWCGPSGSAHGNATLTETQVKEIRRRYAAGEAYQKELANEFMVSQSSIGRMVRGEVWSTAPGPQGPGSPHRGERHHNAKLSSDQVREIRRSYKPGLITQQVLADKFGVSVKHISEILRGNKRKND